MIKATIADREGRPRMLLLGLSHENLNRLRGGEPIKFNQQEVGFTDDVEVLIFAGKTEAEIVAEFEQRGLINDQTIKTGVPDANGG